MCLLNKATRVTVYNRFRFDWSCSPSAGCALLLLYYYYFSSLKSSTDPYDIQQMGLSETSYCDRFLRNKTSKFTTINVTYGQSLYNDMKQFTLILWFLLILLRTVSTQMRSDHLHENSSGHFLSSIIKLIRISFWQLASNIMLCLFSGQILFHYETQVALNKKFCFGKAIKVKLYPIPFLVVFSFRIIFGPLWDSFSNIFFFTLLLLFLNFVCMLLVFIKLNLIFRHYYWFYESQ